MSTYQRILVPVDGSRTSLRGAEEAARLALLSGGRMLVLQVVDELSFALGIESYGSVGGNWREVLQEGASRIVAEAAAVGRELGAEVDTMVVEATGRRLRDVVAEQAELWKADVIVLGTHGRRGARRMILGSGAEQILHGVHLPVLLVRGVEEPAPAAASAHRPIIDLHLPVGSVALE